MSDTQEAPAPQFDFAWARHQWEDPLTGTQMVRLSPDLPRHFRNVYFRTPLFTPDGRTMLMAAFPADWRFDRFDHPSREDCRVPEPTLMALDLLSGETTELGTFPAGKMGLWFAAAPRGRLAHVIVNCGDHEEIEQIEIDSGKRRRIVPSLPLRYIWEGECSADLRYIYTPTPVKPRPPGMSNTEAYHSGSTRSSTGTMFRIDLETGETRPIFETDWALAHPNPNPVRPELFMCCPIRRCDPVPVLAWEAPPGGDAWASEWKAQATAPPGNAEPPCRPAARKAGPGSIKVGGGRWPPTSLLLRALRAFVVSQYRTPPGNAMLRPGPGHPRPRFPS